MSVFSKNFRCHDSTVWLVRCFRRLALAFVSFAVLSAVTAMAAVIANPVNWNGTASVAPGGWGRMILLSGINWLAVSTVYPAGTNSYLSVLASHDNCRSWTVISSVKIAGRTLDNGELVKLPNGNILLTMRDLVDTTSFLLPVYVSINSGASWTYLSNIDSSSGPGGLWEPHFMVLSNAQVAVFYSNETHDGYSQIISEKVSADNGTNWGPEIWASAQVGGGSLRPGMPQSVRLANGGYILVSEVVNQGNADVYYKLSTNGIAWPDGIGTHIPCQHAGPFVTALTDGQIFVTSCQNEISYSRDFGQTWQRVANPAWNIGFNFSWPALYQTSSNELASMVTWGGVNLRFGNLVPPTPWPNPFLDNFASGTDTNWIRYGGNFWVTNNAYSLNDTNSFGKAVTGSEFWTDGTADADVTIYTPGNAGLIVRATNPDYTGPDDGFDYYVGLDTGGVVVFGTQSNAWSALASAPMTIVTNTIYHLRVTMAGSTFKTYVNDMNTPKLTVTDTNWTRGQIGVRAFNCNATFRNVSFSNAAPTQLTLSLAGHRATFSWPLNPVNVKLFSATNISLLSLGSPITGNAAISNGQWNVTLPAAASPQFFWLQGQ